MPRCRHGHDSRTGDWCDECGVPIAAVPPAGQVCPRCGATVVGRFCDEDGYDLVLGDRPAGWVVHVDADPRWFAIVSARRGPDLGAVTLPRWYPSATVALRGPEVRVGRGTGAGVDLTGPPVDPGVSRRHAVLLERASGWSVLDPGSRNGTSVNYAEEPIPVDTPVPLADGDRVHVGAFTTLHLRLT